MYYSGPWANRQLKLDPKEISAVCMAEDPTNVLVITFFFVNCFSFH